MDEIDIEGDILGEAGRKAISACVKVIIKGEQELQQYDAVGATDLVLSCFKQPIPQLPYFLPKNKKTFDIRDVKRAVDSLKGTNSLKIIEKAVRDIDDKFNQANAIEEIEWGTGFFITDSLIITNQHVIEEVRDKKDFSIKISNEIIDAATNGKGFKCEIVGTDPFNDLALLYSPDLSLKNLNIEPLTLSDLEVKPGIPIFSFGYPLGYNGNAALLTQGYVSGVTKRYGKPDDFIALNCPLNPGNSGGPILCKLNGRVMVVGVAVQKHFKEILSIGEREAIDKIKEDMKTRSITPSNIGGNINESFKETDFGYIEDYNYDSIDFINDRKQDTLNILVLKLYDALRTHSQFNQSDAAKCSDLIKFIKKCENEKSQEYSFQAVKIVNSKIYKEDKPFPDKDKVNASPKDKKIPFFNPESDALQANDIKDCEVINKEKKFHQSLDDYSGLSFFPRQDENSDDDTYDASFFNDSSHNSDDENIETGDDRNLVENQTQLKK